MTTQNLDSEFEQLHTATQGQTAIITLEETVRPAQLTKIPGLAILIGPGVRPVLERMLRKLAGVDVAQVLGLSTKQVSRLKGALGIPLDPREGKSRTTAWRRQKAAEAAKEKEQWQNILL